ncbi:potassium-transporting ATPase subunit C [Streptomyces sp. NPDC005526]|uniref:potassium-transporting ATPase subunit C n=1 Tax=Streptomyces sp. NPDC005526 TaxID=3156885 RepID=UPI0033B1EF43
MSPACARIRVDGVAERNGVPVARVEWLVRDRVPRRTPGLPGEPRVKVVEIDTAPRERIRGDRGPGSDHGGRLPTW